MKNSGKKIQVHLAKLKAGPVNYTRIKGPTPTTPELHLSFIQSAQSVLITMIRSQPITAHNRPPDRSAFAKSGIYSRVNLPRDARVEITPPPDLYGSRDFGLIQRKLSTLRPVFGATESWPGHGLRFYGQKRKGPLRIVLEKEKKMGFFPV